MTRKRLKQGLIQVYTGDGKGKTTCALGLGLRAVGQGFKVFMVQFLKTEDTGEVAAARRLREEGWLHPESDVVLFLTGNGFKYDFKARGAA